MKPINDLIWEPEEIVFEASSAPGLEGCDGDIPDCDGGGNDGGDTGGGAGGGNGYTGGIMIITIYCLKI